MIEPMFRVRCDHQGCTNSVTVYKKAEVENVVLARMNLSSGGWETLRTVQFGPVRDFCPAHAGNGRTDWMDSIRALADWIDKHAPNITMTDISAKLRDMIEDED